jgi:hypothetical protein
VSAVAATVEPAEILEVRHRQESWRDRVRRELRRLPSSQWYGQATAHPRPRWERFRDGQSAVECDRRGADRIGVLEPRADHAHDVVTARAIAIVPPTAR